MKDLITLLIKYSQTDKSEEHGHTCFPSLEIASSLAFVKSAAGRQEHWVRAESLSQADREPH